MYTQESRADRQVFRHHLLKFIGPLAGTCLLVLGGTVFLWLWPPAGLFLWGLALLVAAWVYLTWRWTTITLTTDNRLIYRWGFKGRRKEMISLFGRLSLDQGAVVGRLLDEGSIYLGIPGRDLRIDHIARFSAFRRRLEYRPQQRANPPNERIVPLVIVVAPPPQRHAGPFSEFDPTENGTAWIEHGTYHQ